MSSLSILRVLCYIFLVISAVKCRKNRRGQEVFTEKKSNKLPDPTKTVYQARKKSSFSSGRRPNIILVLTDDQDSELGSLQFMPKLGKYLRERGAAFNNGFASTPMCCPSRSSLLTGLYVHNHQVFTNNDNCSSSIWQETHEQRTFATYLSQAGYKTGYFGKYLNKYSGDHIPPGWDYWAGLVRNSRFYNYSLNHNGDIEQHGANYAADYLPDVVTNLSLSFLHSQLSASPEVPLLAVLSYPGPHGPEDAAPQYQNLFFNVTTHHTPAYDFAPNPDKQWILRHTDKMLPVHRSFTDLLMTKRLQTLQSVDAGLEQLHSLLESLGQLENTYIFYTSDHGYHLGQFGLVKGKAFPFDFDTKVPFLVSGPGVAALSSRSQPVLNIDLAPTFLDIAGLTKPPHMDGKSLLPILSKENKKLRDSFLIERGKMTVERYEKVKADQAVLGSSLLSRERLTKQERLAVECSKQRYHPPCDRGQRWVCKVREDGSKKISRCKGSSVLAAPVCHCGPGDTFGWRYPSPDPMASGVLPQLAKISPKEKKMQKKFLKQHLDEETLKKLSPKFLGTLPSLSRHGRSLHLPEHHVDQALLDMADDDLVEVDVTMEDIAETIRTLKNTTTLSTSCQATYGQVFCHNEVALRKSSWLSNRSTIKHQIKTLRAQLNELKAIRRYLREKGPGQGGRQTKQLQISSKKAHRPMSANSEVCLCPHSNNNLDLKAERAKRRQERKIARREQQEKKRLKKEKKARKKAGKVDHCKADVRMNCFSHDNDHWRTAPLWTGGPFCACTNSNNNTYWCARTINATHNYLYCEYVTGMITYTDLRVDPHQLRNLFHTLTDQEVNYMHGQVVKLREYSGERTYLQRQKQKQNLALRKRAEKKQRKMKRLRGTNSQAHGGSVQSKLARFLPPPEYYKKRG